MISLGYTNSRKSHSVAFQPWANRVKELFDEKKMPLPERLELIDMYHNDLSYEEVLYKEQFKTRKNFWMIINVRSEHGVFEKTFRNSNQLKEFFRKFPELRKDLDDQI